jgi:pyridoxal phosphate enzyme (YggS family)
MGATDIGENRVQEAQSKARQLADLSVRWHMIGHLQRNKARDAAGLFALIHSVDSERLARELEKRADQEGRTLPVLIEVNTSGEPQKFGVSPDDVLSLTMAVSGLDHLELRGLMTMAPVVEKPDDARPCFRKLRELRDQINETAQLSRPLTELSMGMTQDFEVAIEEGATMVRVGSALFRGMDP